MAATKSAEAEEEQSPTDTSLVRSDSPPVPALQKSNE